MALKGTLIKKVLLFSCKQLLLEGVQDERTTSYGVE